MLDLKQIQYLRAIIDNDFNITKAAEELFISQPALSKMLKNIEDDASVDLFSREKGRLVSLTPAGEIFYEQSDSLLKRYNKMINNMIDVDNTYSETISLAVPSFILTLFFRDLIKEIHVRFPKIKFKIHEIYGNNALEKISSNDYDITILTSPTGFSNQDIEEIPLNRCEIGAFLFKNHPLSKNSLLTWKDISNYPLTLTARHFSPYKLVLSKFESMDLFSNIQQTSATWDYVMSSILETSNIVMYPKYTLSLFTEKNKREIIYRPLKDPVHWQSIIAYNTRYKRSKEFYYVKDFIYNKLSNF